MPSNTGTAVTLGVEDYLLAFKRKGTQGAVRQFLDLYYQPDQINRWITAEGFLPVTKSGLEKMSGNEKLKPYLAAPPTARPAPTTDPVWDKVKLDVQQNIGAAVQPGGDPKQVLDRLQKNAAASARRPPRPADAAEPAPPAARGGGAGRALLGLGPSLLLIGAVVVYPAVELVRASLGRYSI